MSDVTRLTLHPDARRKCNEAILITGVARSGTSIMSQLVHSMEGVEYVHEPPMLYSVFALIDTLAPWQWRLLYETYLVEEFLFSALAGRALNCNAADESSIYRVKEANWVQGRLSRSLRKREAQPALAAATLVYKMPDVTQYLPRVQQYYPGLRVLMMVRNANDVIHSVLERQLFADEMLRRHELIWPNRLVDGLRVPYWVRAEELEAWCAMDAVHRAAYYYVRAYEGLEHVRNLTVVNYDELVCDPQRIVNHVASAFRLRPGPKTPELVAAVQKTDKDRNQRYVERMAHPLRERVLMCEERWVDRQQQRIVSRTAV